MVMCDAQAPSALEKLGLPIRTSAAGSAQPGIAPALPQELDAKSSTLAPARAQFPSPPFLLHLKWQFL